jgi:hypothetical protein
MLLKLREVVVRALIALNLAVLSAVAQQANPAPAAPFNWKPYGPVCSTEIVNRDCVLNIDRRYPVSLPTIRLHRNSHITVNVFHSLPFETLTLDSGNPVAYESSDQASAVLTAVVPLGKGATGGVTLGGLKEDSFTADIVDKGIFEALTSEKNATAPSQPPPPPSYTTLVDKILNDIKSLNSILSASLLPVREYLAKTNGIYAEIREVESPLPRPVSDVANSEWLAPGVPGDRPDPWKDYSAWRTYTIKALQDQGNMTTALMGLLPEPCQAAAPAPGPWSPSLRLCQGSTATGTSEPSPNPLAIDNQYQQTYADMTTAFGQLKAMEQNCPTTSPSRECQAFLDVSGLKGELERRHDTLVNVIIPTVNELLPGIITKATTDMESLYENISLAPDLPAGPLRVGVIPGPASVAPKDPQEKRYLAPYKALAPQIGFNINAQNQIANTLMQLPATTQKQSIVTITALYAAPRLEGSTGAFLSWLPNRSFSNYTEVSVTGNVPSPVDVKLTQTKTTPPLVIPFAAANYRISPEFTWLGGRRGAVYATLGVGLNPYNTQVEFPVGLSVSWRFLMFSPLFHLGHDIHLTQGEQVGQTWCVYSSSASSTTSPPACSGAPPTPTTTTFWRGAAALGIGIRIPTTFASTNPQ